jgi:alpha-beta hydrolase superfamily lysophospholipase
MKHQEGYFKGTGGINLYYQSWRLLDNPHVIVVIVHGLGSHSNLFGNIVQYLVKTGYAVYGLDVSAQ